MNQSLLEQLQFKIDDENLSIRSEQIRARIQSYPRMVAARAAVTLLVVGLMWDAVAHAVLLVWASLMFLIYAVELVQMWRYRQAATTLAECKIWRIRLLLMVTLGGALWGAGGLLLFVPDDLAHQAMLICVVLGLSAGAATTNPVFPPALYIFVVLLIVPLMLANMLVGDVAHFLLAGMLLLFLVYVLNAGRTLADTFELSLRQSMDNRQLVLQLTAEKQRAELAQQQAEQASVTKSKFLAAASHDLRQPMHALTMFVEALKPHVHGEQGCGLMAQVETSVDVLGEMFDTLLDISRLDAGVVTPRMQLFSLQYVLDRVRAEFSMVAGEKGLRFNMESCATEINNDPILLERILRNLLANAIRYTERGEVAVLCKASGENLSVEVRDSGIGIADHNLQRIFDEYYQVGNKQRDRTQGLGLGLAIVQRLVDLLGCKIQVSSTLGVGSSFVLMVPLTRADDMMRQLETRRD